METTSNNNLFLQGKAQTAFWSWYLLPETLNANKLSSQHKYSNDNAIKISFLAMSDVCQYAVLTEFFDSVGITVDVIPRMHDDKIVFVMNTFCLKHEIHDEGLELEPIRKNALKNAIIFANNIYNKHF